MGDEEMKITSMKDIKEQRGYLIYSRDVDHVHSPAVQALINLVMNHIDEAVKRADEGENVIWFGLNGGAPLVYACGAIPLSPPDMARAGRMADIEEAVKFFQIPEETCYMVKAIVGGYYRYRNSNCRRIAFPGSQCEPRIIVQGLMKDYGYDYHVVDIFKKPSEGDKERSRLSRQNYDIQYKKLAKWINGVGYSEEKLRQELIRGNRIQDKVLRIMNLEKIHASYIKALPSMLIISGIEHYYGQPENYEKILDDIIAEMENLPENAYDKKGVPLVWSGLRGVDFSVYNAIDSAGGQIVSWNLPTTSYHKYDLSLDPFDSLIDHVYNGKLGENMRHKISHEEKMFYESGAKGMILYCTLGCTILTTSIEKRRKHLNNLNIPILQISGVSQIGEITGQIRTRVNAFIEMLS